MNYNKYNYVSASSSVLNDFLSNVKWLQCKMTKQLIIHFVFFATAIESDEWDVVTVTISSATSTESDEWDVVTVTISFATSTESDEWDVVTVTISFATSTDELDELDVVINS